MRTLLLICALTLASNLFAGNAVDEIKALLQEQDAAWSRGDLDGFMKNYDRSGALVFMTADGPMRSYDELKARYEKRYSTGRNDFGKLTSTDLQVEELAPGIARAYGRWTVEQNGKTMTGWFTLILKKTAAGWKIVHDHSS